ncbi:MAG: NAD(P)-dependent oxidoreductase, partial [Chloroflexi bacterium]|nr:NAD(P)-dependent oxidoreductase [Chloroflexota bacterium]
MGMKGKKVFITAAGQGIGRAITERLIKEGAEVEATDLNPDTLKGIQGAKSYVLDVTDKSALQNSINKFQPDVLINCAGIVNHGTIMTSSDKEFDFAVNLNIKSMFHGIQAAI